MKIALITLGITLGIIAVCVLLMSVKVIFKKNGRFPTGHVSDVPALRKRGITCHRSQMLDEINHKDLKDILKEENR